MRYAIFSDIHANRQAWAAVLSDLRTYQADVLVCLGDVVGYGPKPLEVLNAIRAETANFVIGNHDAAAAGLLDSSCFNEQARRVIEWTGRQLNRDAIDFIGRTPLTLEDESLCFVHAEIIEPWRFGYVEAPVDAAENLAAFPLHRLIFLGHTHFPTAFVETSGTVEQFPDRDFTLGPGQRAIINVGSVGEPRNPEDFRARYVLFDSELDSVFFRAVEFDIEAYRADLIASGLEIEPFFLRAHDQKAVESALERLRDFAPVIHPGATQTAPVPVEQVRKLHVPPYRPPSPKNPPTRIVIPPPPVAAPPGPHPDKKLPQKKAPNKVAKPPQPKTDPEKAGKRSAAGTIAAIAILLAGGLAAGYWRYTKKSPEAGETSGNAVETEPPSKSPWVKPPGGGISLLRNSGKKNWRVQGLKSKDWKEIQIADMPFSDAVSISVPKGDPKKRFRYQFEMDGGGEIRQGDVVWVTFFIRGKELGKSGDGMVQAHAYFQQNSNKYDKIIGFPIKAEDKWRQYAGAVNVKKDFPSNQTNFVIHLAYGKQRIEIGGIEILNFRNNLSVSDLPKRR